MTSTILSNANNTQIIGGQFSINNNNSINRNGIDLLREHCAIGALLDSSERFDPPRCAAETREVLIKETLAWIYGGGESASIAWLFGGAGAGKSALAQTIAEILQKKGHLAGSFFFSRTSTANRSDGTRLIPTLVFQLLETYSDLKPHIEECINKHSGLFERSSKTQMDLLFIKPLTILKPLPNQTSPTPSISPMVTPSILSAVPNSKSRRRDFVTKALRKFTRKSTVKEVSYLSQPRLIVIDGLDECNGQEIQVDLLRILASSIPQLPIPLRFLITSRPEGNITRTFDYDESFQHLNIHRISLGDDDNAANDIQQFLMKAFEEIRRTHPLRSLLGPSWPSQDAINTLVQKSSSHFIYASTAMKYIQYSRGKPDNRLEVILGLSVVPTTDKPFAELDALYAHIFNSMEEPDRTTVNSVFGIVHVAAQSLYSSIKTSPTALEGYLGLQAGEINLLLEPLFSLVVLSDNREADIKILHASLFDFLLDESRSGSLHLDLEMAHGIIANYWFQDMLTYSLDTLLVTLSDIPKTEFDTGRNVLESCWMFLSHGRFGCLSDNLRDYSLSFPFLYDAILHPKFITKCMMAYQAITMSSTEELTYILLLLQMYFTLLVEKGFDNGAHLHVVHTMKIEQRFQSIRGGLGTYNYDLTNNSEPLFNNIINQNEHRVYKAFLDAFLSFNHANTLSKILIEAERWGNGEILISHCLIASLPYLTREHVVLCTKYAAPGMTGYSPSGDKELHRVLQKRVVEYIQRVEPDADQKELSKFKEAWSIEV